MFDPDAYADDITLINTNDLNSGLQFNVELPYIKFTNGLTNYKNLQKKNLQIRDIS